MTLEMRTGVVYRFFQKKTFEYKSKAFGFVFIQQLLIFQRMSIAPEKQFLFQEFLSLERPDQWMSIQRPFCTKEIIQSQGKIGYQTLIKYHRIYGNKWKQISKHLLNTSDAFIKNKFYTLTRKALRKINLYIEMESRANDRKTKVFKLNFVFKLANLAESQRMSDAQENLPNSKGFYTKLLYSLLELGKTEQEILRKISQSNFLSQQERIFKMSIDALVQNLKTIEKIFIQQNLTKKGRTKKKFPKKGLIQKAYSSQAFKNSLDDFQTFSLEALSTDHSQQYIRAMQFEQFQDSQNNWQLEAVNQSSLPLKNELDNFLEQKTFDPILFQ